MGAAPVRFWLTVEYSRAHDSSVDSRDEPLAHSDASPDDAHWQRQRVLDSEERVCVRRVDTLTTKSSLASSLFASTALSKRVADKRDPIGICAPA